MSVKKFTVVESRWLRGKRSPFHPDVRGDVESRLLDKDGAQCCMGFLAEACGVPPDIRADTFYFSAHLFRPFDHLLPEALQPCSDPDHRDLRAHGKLATEIYCTNDDPLMPDKVRKEKLTALFAEAGIEVEFVP